MIDQLSLVQDALAQSARVKQAMAGMAPDIARVAERMTGAFRAGRHLYACGNGGSACDAMHLVEELVARYKRDRPGLPAHHMMDAATLTCWANDYDYEGAFERQVEAMMAAGDILLVLSTSGNSENVVRAVEAARRRGALTIGLSGRDGGRLRDLCDELLLVPADATERIQEGHITIIHILCDLVELSLFGERPASTPAATVPTR